MSRQTGKGRKRPPAEVIPYVPPRRALSRHTPIDDLPERLTVKEFSQLTDTGLATVYQAVKRGALPAIQIGHRVLIPKTALGNEAPPAQTAAPRTDTHGVYMPPALDETLDAAQQVFAPFVRMIVKLVVKEIREEEAARAQGESQRQQRKGSR